MEIDDLSSEKIPKGQRRLIMHITRTLLHQDDLDGTANKGTADASNFLSAGVTGTAGTTPIQVTQEVEQEVEPEDAAQTTRNV